MVGDSKRGETQKNFRNLKVLNRMENKAKEFGKQFILVNNNTKDMRYKVIRVS